MQLPGDSTGFGIDRVGREHRFGFSTHPTQYRKTGMSMIRPSGIRRLLLLAFLSLFASRAQATTNPAELNSAPSDSVVVFNEVMYHPTNDDPSLEWVELHNQMSVDVDLSNWSLAGGVRYQFPVGTVIPVGGYVVVAANPGLLRISLGAEGVFGPWTGKLNNAGDTLVLRNHNGRPMDQLTYLDTPPWPPGADGSGASLSKIRRLTASGPAVNWQSSLQVGGTPGRVNFASLEGEPPPIDIFIRRDTASRYRVPSAASPSTPDWFELAFNDAEWNPATASIGFELAVPATTSSHPPERYYSLDATLLDGSGSGVEAISVGTTFSTNVPPNLGKTSSVDFQGTSQYLEISDPIDPEAYTVTTWMRAEAIRPSSLVVRTDASGPASTWSHQIRLGTGGKLEHYLYDGGARTVIGTTVIKRTNWYHVAITCQSGGTMKLFVNGVQEGASLPVGTAWTGGDRWRLGSNSGDNRTYFDGQLSEVGIWHQELSSAEIARLAQGVSPVLLQGLRGLYATDVSQGLYGVNSSLWMRIPFLVNPGIRYDRLSLDVQYADGFVAWLNGEEIARRNAPALISWNSAATRDRPPLDAIRADSFDLSPNLSLLRSGPNLLAIQLLNATSGDSNTLFTPQLRARQASDQSDSHSIEFSEIPPAQAAPFWVELHNYGGQAIDLTGMRLQSSANKNYTLPAVTLGSGEYWVFQVGPLGLRPTVGDRLHLLSASGTDLFDSVVVVGVLQARSAEAPIGEWLYPAQATPGSANQIEHQEEIVINEIFYHAPPNYPKSGRPAQTTNTLLLPFDAVWSYDNSGTDLGSAWKEVRFDDAGWPSGPGGLGTATGTFPVPIKTPIAGNGHTNFYFRTQFHFDGMNRPFQVLLTSLIDDGAIFYLNGTEVLRDNMTNGAVSFLTRAATNRSAFSLSVPRPIPTNALVIGENILAVEVHQFTVTSAADFLLAARLHISEELSSALPGEEYSQNDEEWIELYNRSQHTVSLAGWRLADAIDFRFPTGIEMAPASYLVVARDAQNLLQRYPDVAITGNYSGKLSHTSDRIRLLDARGNPANEVRYFNEKPWPAAPDAGGSSLELKDPRGDNSVAEAWAASDETARSPWQHYETTVTAITPVFSPDQLSYPFHELRLCLLDAGEAWLDNVSVIEEPSFAPRELIQNGSFDTGLSKWRVTGNHSHTVTENDPDHPGNRVMRLIATGAGSYLENIIETTFKIGTAFIPIVAGREYRVSFDAKWISGTPLLRSEFYYNKVAFTTRLATPERHGTPGRRNSRFTPNSGPTYRCLTTSPVVPKYRIPIEVSVQANDPDGIELVTLRYAINGTNWQSLPMQAADGSLFRATLPAQTNAVLIQFYIAGADSLGATTAYPAGGTNSRAYIKVDNAPPLTKVPLVRILMDPREAARLMQLTNLMSDDTLECTLVLGDREAIYGSGARLHGSMFSRSDQNTVGFNVQFPADRPYKGVRTSMIWRRRDHGEIVTRHMLANARNVPGNYDEFIHLISPLPGNAGIARVIFGNDDGIWLKSQYGTSPQVFKMEGIREFQAPAGNGMEGYKLAMPIGWRPEFDLRSLGDDQEQYRWSTLIANHRDQDDYSRYIAMAKVFGLTGTNLQQAVPDVMDVEEWSKIFGLQSLCGVADVYTVENPHNLGYLIRPSDGKVLALQNDWSFYFNRGTSEPLIGVQNLSKIFKLPVYKRVYYGVLLDLMNTTYNKAYISRWTQHYGELAGESYTAFNNYIADRSAFARAQFPKPIPFQVTTGDGQDVVTHEAAITVTGRGWIDVYQIVLMPSSNLLNAAWLDIDQWQTQVALVPGTNDLTFTAYDRSGAKVGSANLRVISSSTDRPQHDALRISEIMYHPPSLTDVERQAGITDAEQFEFVELVNIGEVPISLKGVQFTGGIRFLFTGSPVAQLDPGQHLVVVRNPSAFQIRYPTVGVIAGTFTGSLDNGGESLRLVDPYGAVIEEFAYGDSGAWPSSADGDGSSLERISFVGTAGNADAWQASTDWGGSPAGPVRISTRLEAQLTTADSIDLRLVIPSGAAYQLEYRDRLDTGAWQSMALIPSSTTPRVEHRIDSIGSATRSRYYRLTQ